MVLDGRMKFVNAWRVRMGKVAGGRGAHKALVLWALILMIQRELTASKSFESA